MGNRQITIMCIATLMLTGLVMVYSNTAVSCGVNPVTNAFLIRQAICVVLSVIMIAAFANIDYHSLARWGRVIMLLSIVALVVLLFFGTRVNGAKRWFRIGPLSLQISEFVKIAIIIYVAEFASRKREVLGKFVRGLVPPLLVLGVTFGLIMLQPDFGTAALIAMVVMTMLIVSGARWRHIVPLVVTALPLLLFLVRMREYRWRRLIVFIDPWIDRQGAGYHVVQSLIALGCGGLAGVGPGCGLQKLGFLPEAETDFIFAIFGQETGFIGCVLLMGVFVALFYAGMRIARSAPDSLGAVLAFGVTALIGFQMLINVAVACSAMPTKGISLPFVSFGGSSLLALSAGIGIMLNVGRHCPRERAVLPLGATKRGIAV